MKKIMLLMMTVIAIAFFTNASAELVVITNANNGINKLSKADIVNLYMGKNRKFPNGLTALPVDLRNTDTEKAQFYSSLTGKELPEINSYRARLHFSGLGSPPVQAESMDEVLNIVGENKGAIGYIDRKKLDKRVKLIYILNPSP
ncbi:hypothetical protein ACO0K0_12520 [Undibacterium sp. SXout11W]|uniref:hypothetical protein n=1 Tax=Undibacterium sp. SXout11W TaxID=3413050 RepID=UPI003BF12014